ncbi:MtrB/PioB family outer membrane beta-barrel protein, partial [Shewanella sp. 6_MG-2023]|uniref:MtrB/PioB family outer membrane beta-barrel protein n=1 Tax=Shewanella sp. 6_MG-2023 TaxID=3062660 RepID=UPI0026E29363
MSFKLNIITLSLLAVSTSGMAANFGVGNANTTAVNTHKYECKRCTNLVGYSGEVSVAAGYNSISDIHAGNALGTAKDGGIAAVSGDVRFNSESGYQARIQAHQLGMDNGFAHVSGGKAGLYEFSLDYDAIKTYKAGDVESSLWHNDGMLTPSDAINSFDLAQRREKVALGMEYGQDFYGAFVKYSQ